MFSISDLVLAVVVVAAVLVIRPDTIDFPKAPAVTQSDFQAINSQAKSFLCWAKCNFVCVQVTCVRVFLYLVLYGPKKTFGT